MGKENKPHIAVFGRRNNGKSSVINILAGQEVAIVSDTPGTTTDPVKKSIEIPGVGPSVIIDTAGLDDTGDVGGLRVKRSLQVLAEIDLAILVITGNVMDKFETGLIDMFKKQDVPFFIIHNKADITALNEQTKKAIHDHFKADVVDVSVVTKKGRDAVFVLLKKNMPETVYQQRSLLGGLLSYGDIVMLITPIDIEAPEGRMILPQVQAIRDIIDNDCIAVVLKEREVDTFLKKTAIKPKLAVTDSQVFLKADASVPKDIPLTGFSVLLAYHKGDFQNYLEGTPKISALKDGDRVLLLESCTHQVSCDDIGRVKIPRWMQQFTGKNLEFDVVAGLSKLERKITDYALVVQCGGCMITRRQIINRLKPAVDAGIPVTNYGMTIAYLQGVYNRAIAPFVDKAEYGVDYL